MWAKNALFLAVCAAGLLAFSATVFPDRERPVPQPLRSDPSRGQTVERVDAAFEALWRSANLEPAAPASDLAVARRIALALTGTILSLEEIRRFESWPADERIARWLDERLADRRAADYLAERLARACVGVEEGPFLV